MRINYGISAVPSGGELCAYLKQNSGTASSGVCPFCNIEQGMLNVVLTKHASGFLNNQYQLLGNDLPDFLKVCVSVTELINQLYVLKHLGK